MEATVRRELPMILIRVIVGLVFVLEGALKFVLPEELGAGRFALIGLPLPHALAPLIGGVEICGVGLAEKAACGEGAGQGSCLAEEGTTVTRHHM